MKLHLGCGRKLIPGWTNCDLPNNAYAVVPDVPCDIRHLPFEDETADEIMAIHVFEHFWVTEVDEILEEWKRVLKPGGKLILETPCLDKVARWLREGAINPRLTLFALYGDPSTFKNIEDLHKWCWSERQITLLLQCHDFRNCKILAPEYHVEVRDMRVEAIK